MLKKALLATALTMVSGVALAHPPHWAPAYGYRANHYRQPQLRYYYPPAPHVVYRPVPVYPVAPGIVIRLRFPL